MAASPSSRIRRRGQCGRLVQRCSRSQNARALRTGSKHALLAKEAAAAVRTSLGAGELAQAEQLGIELPGSPRPYFPGNLKGYLRTRICHAGGRVRAETTHDPQQEGQNPGRHLKRGANQPPLDEGGTGLARAGALARHVHRDGTGFRRDPARPVAGGWRRRGRAGGTGIAEPEDTRIPIELEYTRIPTICSDFGWRHRVGLAGRAGDFPRSVRRLRTHRHEALDAANLHVSNLLITHQAHPSYGHETQSTSMARRRPQISVRIPGNVVAWHPEPRFPAPGSRKMSLVRNQVESCSTVATTGYFKQALRLGGQDEEMYSGPDRPTIVEHDQNRHALRVEVSIGTSHNGRHRVGLNVDRRDALVVARAESFAVPCTGERGRVRHRQGGNRGPRRPTVLASRRDAPAGPRAGPSGKGAWVQRRDRSRPYGASKLHTPCRRRRNASPSGARTRRATPHLVTLVGAPALSRTLASPAVSRSSSWDPDSSATS